MKKLNNKARIERNAYQRQWRLKNKERVQKYNADYWQRRATKRKLAEPSKPLGGENYVK